MKDETLYSIVNAAQYEIGDYLSSVAKGYLSDINFFRINRALWAGIENFPNSDLRGITLQERMNSYLMHADKIKTVRDEELFWLSRRSLQVVLNEIYEYLDSFELASGVDMPYEGMEPLIEAVERLYSITPDIYEAILAIQDKEVGAYGENYRRKKQALTHIGIRYLDIEKEVMDRIMHELIGGISTLYTAEIKNPTGIFNLKDLTSEIFRQKRKEVLGDVNKEQARKIERSKRGCVLILKGRKKEYRPMPEISDSEDFYENAVRIAHSQIEDLRGLLSANIPDKINLETVFGALLVAADKYEEYSKEITTLAMKAVMDFMFKRIKYATKNGSIKNRREVDQRILDYNRYDKYYLDELLFHTGTLFEDCLKSKCS